jgi:hypothetical protein
MKMLLLAATLLAAAAPAAPQATREPRLPIAWDRFYDYDGIVDLCRQLAQSRPDLCRLEWLGESFEGRPMPLLVVSNPATGAEAGKAAMWVDGNVHGNEVQGAEASLYLVWTLLERHGELPEVTALVDERVFYVCPMVNPDGRQAWFAEAHTSSSSRSGRAPVDDDRDGAFDEDPPNDLDGDGELLTMRLRVPPGEGTHRVSPADPRRMESVPREKRRELGADLALLGQEGVDDDGDGRVNEDEPGEYDLNRNWPSGWQPEWIQFGAGDFPLSHPEPAHIARFLLAHPNVAAVQSFHNSGGMILRGPGTKSREDLYPREDREAYDAIARDGEAMLPFYESMVIWKDLYEVHGGFVNWCAEGLGIISFTNELWSGNQYFAEQGEGGLEFADGSERRLKFDDLLLFGETWVDWRLPQDDRPRAAAVHDPGDAAPQRGLLRLPRLADAAPRGGRAGGGARAGRCALRDGGAAQRALDPDAHRGGGRAGHRHAGHRDAGRRGARGAGRWRRRRPRGPGGLRGRRARARAAATGARHPGPWQRAAEVAGARGGGVHGHAAHGEGRDAGGARRALRAARQPTSATLSSGCTVLVQPAFVDGGLVLAGNGLRPRFG